MFLLKSTNVANKPLSASHLHSNMFLLKSIDEDELNTMLQDLHSNMFLLKLKIQKHCVSA